MARFDQFRPAPKCHVVHEIIPTPMLSKHVLLSRSTRISNTSKMGFGRMDVREEVKPGPDYHHLACAVLGEALDELAQTARHKVLILLSRGGTHATPPVFAPPQVHVCVLDPNHGRRVLGEPAPDEICNASARSAAETETTEEEGRRGRTGTLRGAGGAEEGVDHGGIADGELVRAYM